MTGKRMRRLQRLLNRAARSWAHVNRQQGYGMASAWEWRRHFMHVVPVMCPAQVAQLEAHAAAYSGRKR